MESASDRAASAAHRGPRAVTIVAYHYPPDGEVGALRADKIAHSFLKRGFDVNVIAGPGDPPPPLPRRTVARVANVLDPRALYSRLRNRGTRAGTANTGTPAATTWVPPERVPAWKRYVSSVLWLPDDRQGWILPAARAAVRAVRSGSKLLYTSAPPQSVHLVGLLAKLRTGAFWVAEFRDPWTDNPWKPAFVRSRWSDAADRWLERRCLRTADLIVTVTESFAERLRTRIPARRHDRILVVRNGIDHIASSPAPNLLRETVELLYVGNLYQGRDPRPFFRALGELDRQKRLPAAAQVEFIGDCTFHGVSLASILDEYGIRERVTISGRIPHDQCLRRVADASLLLLFAQDQPLQVPNKLYEYLGARHPIVAFVDGNGETARMLRQAGGHFVIDTCDPARIADVLEAAFKATAIPPSEHLYDWTTDNQLARLHAALEARFA
ncbi:MAG: glycosyltransferase [Longimicrobiales bacterium]